MWYSHAVHVIFVCCSCEVHMVSCDIYMLFVSYSFHVIFSWWSCDIHAPLCDVTLFIFTCCLWDIHVLVMWYSLFMWHSHVHVILLDLTEPLSSTCVLSRDAPSWSRKAEKTRKFRAILKHKYYPGKTHSRTHGNETIKTTPIHFIQLFESECKDLGDVVPLNFVEPQGLWGPGFTNK